MAAMSGLEAGKAALEKGTSSAAVAVGRRRSAPVRVREGVRVRRAGGSARGGRGGGLTRAARGGCDAGLILETDFERIRDAFVRGARAARRARGARTPAGRCSPRLRRGG